MTDTTERDGLTITVDDETNILTFSWDDETHPMWNFLHDLGEEGIRKALTDFCTQIFSEDGTEELHDDGLKSQ